MNSYYFHFLFTEIDKKLKQTHFTTDGLARSVNIEEKTNQGNENVLSNLNASEEKPLQKHEHQRYLVI